jgi:hypothetical protein
MCKHKTCKSMGDYRREKILKGNVLGEEFEFLNPETMEIVTLKPVVCIQHGYQCNESCYFRKVQKFSDELDKESKLNPNSRNRNISFTACNEKIWPCYLHACSPRDVKFKIDKAGNKTQCGKGSIYYIEVKKESIKQEENDGEK